MAVDIEQLLRFSVKNKASDLHLSAGVPPMIRIDGDVKRINMPALTHKEVHSMVYDIMNDKQRKDYEEFFETDFSFEIPELARFRVNAFNQHRGAGAVFRTIPSKIMTLDDLNAPKIFKDISMYPRGIVLVTGPTGSGKSTTLAAMIDHVNNNRPDHILTIEDPIEFVHESKKCLINQREVHRDTLGFAEALRSALREDPDVILVGEMRDLETIRLALTAAETGHLVFGTLHTSSAAKTIDRIVDVFPAGEKDGPLDAVGVAARGDQPDAAEEGRRRPHRGARDHDRHAGDPQPDPRGQDRADVLGDPDRPGARHADARPVPAGPAAQGPGQPRRGPLQGPEQGRLLGGLSTPGTGVNHMERDQAIRFIHDLLRKMVEVKGSDLFLTAGFPPAIKVDGRVKPHDQPLTPQQSAALVRSIMNDRQTKEYDATKECNFAIAPPRIGRFRVSAFIQQGHSGAVMRTINTKIPTLEELELPPVLKDVAMTKRGLVLIVGGTGSGKSTTLAAMLGYRNENSKGHIITIEDPVEYVHTHKNCVVTQREVGMDTESWQVALKNTLRQAPDVILIGEIRDRDTMEYGIQFAETGHLCAGHPARQQRQPGAGPRHQLLPRGEARPAADGHVAERQGHGRAAPAAARAARADRGDGDPAGLAADLGPDLQGRGAPAQGSDGALQPARHEDLRPGAVRPVRGRQDLLRGCAAQRRLAQRAQAAHQAGEQARFQGHDEGATASGWPTMPRHRSMAKD
jgi:twitching motility protein PilT